MTGIRSGRKLPTALTALTLCALSATSCGHRAEVKAAEYCAVISDSVGLYTDNPVTQMGYRIGKITSIDPRQSSVEIHLRIQEKRTLPADVRAVVRSPSILA